MRQALTEIKKHRQLLILIFVVLLVSYLALYSVLSFRIFHKHLVTIDEIEWRLTGAEVELSAQLGQHSKLLRVLKEHNEQIRWENTIAVLVMACNRPANINRTLSQIIKYIGPEYHPSDIHLPIIVSQDCADAATHDVIQTFAKYNITHIQQPDQSDMAHLNQKDRRFLGYFKISRHYKWALSHVFRQLNYSTVIVVEDDLDISPDFFEYFIATLPLLRADPTLWCVSAWNDNGKTDLISNETDLLYRTDFFPGLGWMLVQETWLELEPKWPPVFWDDWMREPDQRRSRACIRPEIPRSSTFGREGTSKGQFFDVHLQFIKQCDHFVPFTAMNLSYLLKDEYDPTFAKTVYGAPLVLLDDVLQQRLPKDLSAARLEYSSLEDFKRITKALGLMDDCKSGVPRVAYMGVISFYMKGQRVYLSPPEQWTGYDVKWT